MKADQTSVSNILQVRTYTFDGFYVASESEVGMQGLKY